MTNMTEAQSLFASPIYTGARFVRPGDCLWTDIGAGWWGPEVTRVWLEYGEVLYTTVNGGRGVLARDPHKVVRVLRSDHMTYRPAEGTPLPSDSFSMHGEAWATTVVVRMADSVSRRLNVDAYRNGYRIDSWNWVDANEAHRVAREWAAKVTY